MARSQRVTSDLEGLARAVLHRHGDSQLLEGREESPPFLRRGDGTILTSDCPKGVARKKRRLKLIGAAAASLMASYTAGHFAGIAYVGEPERVYYEKCGSALDSAREPSESSSQAIYK